MKLLNIEIGYSRTIVCEVDPQTKRAYNLFVVPTPDGVLDDGLLRDCDGFAEDLREAIEARGIKTRQAVFTVSGNRIASRDVTIPYIKKSQISEVLTTNQAEYFPMDLKNYRTAYTIREVLKEKKAEESTGMEVLDFDEEPDAALSKKEQKKRKKAQQKQAAKEKKERAKKAKKTKDDNKTGYRLSLLAMPREMIRGYTAFAKKCGLELKDIDDSGNSLYQALRTECADNVQAVIKVNERRTQILILQDGNVVMSRFVPYGMDEAVGEVFDMGLVLPTASYDEAISYLQQSHTLPSAMQDVYTDLVSGILKVLELYESQNPTRQISRILLVGLGGTVNAFCNLLTEEIGMQVDVLTDLAGFHLPREDRNNDLGEFVSCLGASISPANFFEEERKQKRAFGVDLDDLTRIAMVILVLLAIALVVTGLFGYLAEKTRNETLKARFRNYAPALSSYQEYTLSKQAYQYMEDAFASTQLPTTGLVDFIEELEQKMPKDSIVTSFLADKEKVTISMTARDKEEAADAIMQMRTFESLKEVTVSGITDTAQEITSRGGGSVTFTVVGTYLGAEDEEETEAATEPETERIDEEAMELIGGTP